MVSGVLTLFGALACAELASAFPRTGGVYVFLQRDLLAARRLPLGLGDVLGDALGHHRGDGDGVRRATPRSSCRSTTAGCAPSRSAAILGHLRASTTRRQAQQHACRRAFTVAKVLAVGLIVVVGLCSDRGLAAQPISGAKADALAGRTAIGHIAEIPAGPVAGLFAFGGWHVVTYTAEETVASRADDPARARDWASRSSPCLLRGAQRGVLLRPAARQGRVASTRVAADVLRRCSATPGGAAISALVMFSVFGAMTGSMLAAPRVYFAMARDRPAFSLDRATPPAIWHAAPRDRAAGDLGVGARARRHVSAAFTRVIFTEWIFFALMAAGIFLLRRRPGYRRRIACGDIRGCRSSSWSRPQPS